jgi:hypothetical protein
MSMQQFEPIGGERGDRQGVMYMYCLPVDSRRNTSGLRLEAKPAGDRCGAMKGGGRKWG